MMMKVSNKASSCPCCAFLEQDLFLPPDSTTSTITTTTLPLVVDDRAEPFPSPPPSSSSSSEPLEPHEALRVIHEYGQELQKRHETDGKLQPPILLVDTHNHAHLRRERHDAYNNNNKMDDTTTTEATTTGGTSVISLSLAVEVTDWDDAIQYSAAPEAEAAAEDSNAPQTPAAVSDGVLFGIGIHPWYLENVQPDDDDDGQEWIHRLERLLQEHPSAIVGEIGLCKMAKCARYHPEGKSKGFDVQRSVFETQIQIAAQYQRPVSIHCVQQHGVLMDILNDLVLLRLRRRRHRTTEEEEEDVRLLPPAMAMHSFTGTAHHVKALLTWEATCLFGEDPNHNTKKKKTKKTSSQKSDDRRPPLVYFGFSHCVNYGMCTSVKARKQGREAVRTVPLNRLLAESDVHHPLDVASGTAGAVAYIAWALERPITEVAELTARNGLTFLQSHLQRAERCEGTIH